MNDKNVNTFYSKVSKTDDSTKNKVLNISLHIFVGILLGAVMSYVSFYFGTLLGLFLNSLMIGKVIFLLFVIGLPVLTTILLSRLLSKWTDNVLYMRSFIVSLLVTYTILTLIIIEEVLLLF